MLLGVPGYSCVMSFVAPPPPPPCVLPAPLVFLLGRRRWRRDKAGPQHLGEGTSGRSSGERQACSRVPSHVSGCVECGYRAVVVSGGGLDQGFSLFLRGHWSGRASRLPLLLWLHKQCPAVVATFALSTAGLFCSKIEDRSKGGSARPSCWLKSDRNACAVMRGSTSRTSTACIALPSTRFDQGASRTSSVVTDTRKPWRVSG